MRRVPMQPRPDWRRIVEAEGLAYAAEDRPDGTILPYWHEEAAYEFDAGEIDFLERQTQVAHAMAVEAAGHILDQDHLWNTLGLPDPAREYLRWSYATERDWTVYGRFDLAWDGGGYPKVLEYNADTPAALVEAAVTQWTWLEAMFPGNDQWNMLHERLVQAWRTLAPRIPDRTLHLTAGQNEPTEDWVTVGYMSDTAREAGLAVDFIAVEDIGWDHDMRRFVDIANHDMTTVFAMYPWEWMLADRFGANVMGCPSTRWIEPAWKTLLSSKTLLVALWECYPGHELLLPATLGEPGPWPRGYVAKPVYGWEGAGVQVVTPEARETQPTKHTAGQPMVFQEYYPIPRHDGAQPVLGAWVIGGHAAGLGVRETDRHVTNPESRFVPHYMTATRSTPEEIRSWLNPTQEGPLS